MSTSIWDPASEGLLKRRAEQLARQSDDADTRDDVEVLIGRLGVERYAIETASLRAVQWVSGVIPVPCTPPYVVGIVSVRGEIVTLLDLGTMLGLSSTPTTSEPCAVLLLGLRNLRAGLIVDEVIGVESLNMSKLQPSLTAREFTRGLGPGPTVVLDVEALFANGRYTVDES